MQRRFLGICLIFARLHPTASTITLSRFQPVTGFSDECTNTYNTPLSACTALDFANGRPCSQSCIKFLDNLTATIQKACQGAKAYPDTLMGMFFTFQGTKAICPNAQGSDAANGGGVQPIITLTSNIEPSPIPEPIQDKSTEIPKTTTPEPTVISNPAVPDISAETSTTSVTPLDSAAATATSITTIPLSVLTAASTITAGLPEKTDKAEKVEATDGDGGGTPFDITSSSHHGLRPTSLGALVIAGFALLTCLI